MRLDENLGFRFSYAALQDTEVKERLIDVINGKVPRSEGIAIADKLPVVRMWYDLIADANDLDRHHPLVAESYWIGSSLLDRQFDYGPIHQFMLEKFPQAFKHQTPSLPSQRNPPHHNLHVHTYGIVSRDSTLLEREVCMVVPARVISVSDGIRPYVKSMTRPYTFTVENPFELSLEQDSLVALHHNTICATISNTQFESLITYGYENQR